MKPKGGRNCDKMTSLSLNCDVTLGAPEISSVEEREGEEGGGEGLLHIVEKLALQEMRSQA